MVPNRRCQDGHATHKVVEGVEQLQGALGTVRHHGKDLVGHDGAQCLAHALETLFRARWAQHDGQEPSGGSDLAKIFQRDGVLQPDENGHWLLYELDAGNEDET